MRIVLDTNVLLVSIGSASPYRPIFNAILSGKIKLLVTTDIYFEYEEKIEEKTNGTIAKNILKLLLELEATELITVHYKCNLITTDIDDNKFTDCAIAANADYIVTEDSDFNLVKELDFPSVKIIGAKHLLQLLNQ